VSAFAGALPRARGTRPRVRSSAVDPLAFTEPGAPLVALCGLHGGAGTTTLARLLAEAAAAASPAGRVLAVEADARAAELARRVRAASALSLAELALRPGEQTAPVSQRADGLRVLAAVQPASAEAPNSALAAVLAEARAEHALCVVDAGSVRTRAAEPALAGADVVVWVADPARVEPDAFASPLVRPARGARWVLALAPTSTPSS
jgi:Flp pilus assembly CpaE family ATPase